MHYLYSKIKLIIVSLLSIVSISVAVAQSPLTHQWERDSANPVLGRNGSRDWDGGSVYAPSVILDETLFKMWYSGRLLTDTAVVATAIGLATSSDGTNWFKDTRNPVLADGVRGTWDSDGASHAVVLKQDETYHMWYAGWDESALRLIGYATSLDGVSWLKDDNNPVLVSGSDGEWDSKGVSPGSVISLDDKFHMWYTGIGPSQSAQIGLATSPDGVTWTKHVQNPVLRLGSTTLDASGVARPAVLFDGSSYRLWYTALGSDNTSRIGYATSSDGVLWKRHFDELMLEPGGSDEWDSLAVTQPAVVHDIELSVYHLWYTGEIASGTPNVEIGHAVTRVGYKVYVPFISRN